MTQNTIGATIRRARRAADMTQAQLGAATGYSASEISLIERGKRSLSYTRLMDITNYLNIHTARGAFCEQDFLYF